MDPLTQGLLGAVAAQAAVGRRLPRSAWWLGMLAGMAADLDVVIRPAGDPLGGLTYHRHFTHALAFVPVGGLLTALPFLWLRRLRDHRGWVLLATTLAYATHGLLDACTSYGTLLYWPFTERRVAWDFIAIIDPIYTLTLLVFLVLAVWRRRASFAVVGLLLSTAYMGLGAYQHHRVMLAQRALAESRGDRWQRGRALPSPLNLVLYRSIYEHHGRVRADAIRVPLLGETSVYPGADVPLLTVPGPLHAHHESGDSVDLAAIRRFAWFADGYVARHPDRPGLIVDLRYAMHPADVTSLWGLRVGERPGQPPQFVHLERERAGRISWLWDALWGRAAGFVPPARVSAR